VEQQGTKLRKLTMTDTAQEPELASNSCGKCRCWIKQWNGAPPIVGIPAQETMGECHRYSPEPIVGTAQTNVFWPMTRDYDFCGDQIPK
jgi:hypothetical protein